MRIQPATARHPRSSCGALTLVEMLITMVTTVIVLGGAMGAYVYGLKMMQFTQPKLSASDEARKAVSLLTEDVRMALDAKVGNRRNGVFTLIPDGTARIGNALRIYQTSNTNNYILYFCDTNDLTLKRTTNNISFTTVVNFITNDVAFSAENFKGVYLTNENPNFVIGMTLQIYQLKYPRAPIGPGQFYDWYQLRSKVTKRVF